MTLTMRKTTEADVAAAEAILMDGKAALAALGVPQWQGGPEAYPNRIELLEDIANGAGYVAVNEAGELVGTLALSLAGEDTYDEIDGTWLTTSDSTSPRYAVIHRCAVSAMAAHQGVMSFMFEECERLSREAGAESMRIDTHALNKPLQGLVAKRGYTHCGTITLPYEDERDPMRIAFEKLL